MPEPVPPRSEGQSTEREWLEGLRYEDKFPVGVQPGEPATICAGCGDLAPDHWRDDGWYCEGCASCPICDSPYCTEEGHRA